MLFVGSYQGPRPSNFNNNSSKSMISGSLSEEVKPVPQRPRKYKKITDPDGLGSEAWLNFRLDVNAIMACLPWTIFCGCSMPFECKDNEW